MFLCLGWCLDAPCLYAPICSYAPFVHMPQGVYTPPYAPYSSASVCSQRLCMLWGVVRGSPCVRTLPLHHPCMGVPPLHWHPPHSVVASLCIGMFWGYQYVLWAFSLLLRGLGLFPPSVGGFGGISIWDVHMLIHVYFCSALCLTFLLWLRLLLLCLQWYLLACHQSHQWQWVLPWQGFQ